MEGLVTLLFSKVERQNLVSLGILMRIFKKETIYFENARLPWRHYYVIIGLLERPCNFAIFEGRSSKFY